MNQWYIFLAMSVAIFIGIIVNRKRIKIEGKFPFVYIAAFNLNFGVSFVDWVVSKHKRLAQIVGKVCIGIGLLVMAAAIFIMVSNVYLIVTQPQLTETAVKLVMPIESKYTFYVPLWYWLGSIFIIMLVHEFGHALLLRAYDIPINGTGIAVFGLILPIFPGAFVDPAESVLKERPRNQRMAVMAAGSAFNILFAILAVLVSAVVFRVFEMPAVLATFMYWLIVLNLGIGITNLFPAGPLDGAKMIDALIPSKPLVRGIQTVCLAILLFVIIYPILR